MTELLHRSWARLAAAWTGFHGAALRDDLLRRHAEPQRAYHTAQHLEECLAWFEQAAALAEQPAEVEAAIWFHDAVYDPRAIDNETRSAALAEAGLIAAGAPGAAAQRVAALVLATKHDAEPAGDDARLLVDIDLAILGAPPARFAEYERQVRVEYAFVAEDTFREKRRAILRGFLARPRLFSTDFFRIRLEDTARRNLGGAA